MEDRDGKNEQFDLAVAIDSFNGLEHQELVSDSTGEEAFKLARPNRMLELSNRFRFNLPHAFARHFKDATHFFQRVGVAVADAVAELDDLALAIRERLEDLLNFVFEHFLRGAFDRIISLLVFDEIAEVAVFG